MKKRCVVLIVMMVASGCAPRTRFRQLHYPPAPPGDVVEIRHGVKVADPYRWLENEKSPAVQAWINEENALTHNTLGRFGSLQEQIARELEVVYSVDTTSNIHPYGNRYFVLERKGLENHAKLMVYDGSVSGELRVVINPNLFSTEGTVAMDWWFPSPDGSLVAYGKSSSGSEKSTLYIRNVATGKDLADVIPFTQYCYVAWNDEGTGFYYNRCPDPQTVPAGEENFHMKVYFHRIGTDWHDDRYEWGKGRPIDEEPHAYSTSDGAYVLLNFYRDPSRNDLFFKPMAVDAPFQPVMDGVEAITTGDVVDGRLFLRTNFEAPRFRICTASVDAPGVENWKELIPQQKGVIDDFRIVDRKLVVHVVEDVHSRLMVYDLDGAYVDEIPLTVVDGQDAQAPALGTVTSFSGELDKPALFFTYSSWIEPTATMCYDLETKKLQKLHQMACPVDLSPYETRQIWFTSPDGTRVPMFVVARKDIKLNGDNPTLLYGYGGFNVGLFPRYRPRIIPFLLRGGVWALANIRGGGEFGSAWHEGGRLANKQNGFDDFYAAAEKLIELGYTRPERLACKGGSNGGLLIGAAVTQRPKLFAAALSQVPLMDMLRFNLWGMGAQWVHEYGNPENAEDFRWLLAYSPYHNVHKGTAYPGTLIVTAESDNRVSTAHAFKMTAALQAATAGPRPILLRVERQAGHGAGKPLTMRIENQSEDWAFLMWQLGMVGNGDGA